MAPPQAAFDTYGSEVPSTPSGQRTCDRSFATTIATACS